MPKEKINCSVMDSLQVEVGWSNGGDVQVATTNSHHPSIELAMVPESAQSVNALGIPSNGWFCTLDRQGVNELIQKLRRARDAAYGRDQ